ncbi:MAG: DUF6790 family protein [Candidatus Nanopelagicales bacterium]|nr:hypothetical protein [Candidatus Nanopelagicales bacterium]MDZ4248776.1 DUF6790 family protein [Candidatus Nanopelagicales bacterium]MDZ7577125.1 DUF6790 family protein [Candidatus Nanopelagicales bacterium]
MSASQTAADPRPSAWVMYATYAVGAIGIFIGFATVFADPPTLTWSCLLAVGAAGILSFVRHSILHKSDAARMGWDYGRRNNFQIEVGLANLAWGSVAVLAVVLDWGLITEAAMFLTMGLYLLFVAIMQLVWPGGQRRSPGPLAGILAFALALVVLGGAGIMLAA